MVNEDFHRWFCKELSVDKSALILMPREHTKSTWGIAVKVTQDVIRNPNESVLLASKTAGMSKDRLEVIKNHLTKSAIPILFPEIICPDPELESRSMSSMYRDLLWKKEEIRVLRTSQQMELTVETAGINQFKTGRHYDRMYLDDIIDYKTVESEVETENALKFEKSLVPMIKPGGVIFQYGTRYYPGDLYDWLISKIETTDDTDAVKISNWRLIHREVKESLDYYRKYQKITKREFNKRKVWDADAGEWRVFIFPYFTEELLAQKRAFYEDDFLYFCQYHNRVVLTDEKVFPPPYREAKAFPDGLTYYMTIDPAFKPTKRSDFTAVVVCGYDRDNGEFVYVAEAKRLKGDPSHILKTMYAFQDKYFCRKIGMEEGAWQVIMKWAFEYARKQEGMEKLPIMGIKLGNEINAKDKRIRALSYFFKQGVVVLREGLKDLKNELMRYPGNTRSKDDLLDALSMQRELITWGKAVEPKKQWKRQRETWRDVIERPRKYSRGAVY